MGSTIGPNIVINGLVSLFDTTNVKNLLNKSLLYDTSTWSSGSLPGSPFSAWASHNSIINATDPWGDTNEIWQAGGGTTGQPNSDYSAQGGIYCSTRPIKSTDLYRMSYWENRKTNTTGTYGRYYFGCNGYGAVSGIGNLGSGTANTNPYFWSTAHTGLPIDIWFLVVGHIHPYTYTSYAEHVDSGRWNVDGTKIGNINTDYKFLEGTTSVRPRTLTTYYAKDTTTLHHSLYPRMDLVDGTEPSLDDLLHNRPHRMIDSFSKKNVFVNKTSYDAELLTFDISNEDTVNLGDIEDLGDSFTMGAWVYVDSFSSTFNPILSRDGNTLNNFSFGFNINGKIKISQYGGSSFNRGSISSEQWYHIMVSMDNKVGTLYINGISQSTSFTFPNSFSDVGDIKVGAMNTSYFNGNINLTHIYNRSLSSSEILRNYNSSKSKFTI